VNSKTLLINIMLYYNQTEIDDLSKQCLLAFHQCCKRPDFRELCYETHKFPPSTFDAFVKNSIKKWEDCVKNQDWAMFINASASITGFVTVFPERMPDYKCLIKPLIDVVSNKTEVVRKNAAVCLAKLSQNEENGVIMRANHGTEVLLSLRSQLA
jgi:hypothetical protein